MEFSLLICLEQIDFVFSNGRHVEFQPTSLASTDSGSKAGERIGHSVIPPIVPNTIDIRILNFPIEIGA
jgi:hypothetical protein